MHTSDRLAQGRSGIARPMAWLAGLLLLLVVAGAGLLWLQDDRARQDRQREALRRTEQRAQQLTGALAGQVQAHLGGIDVALRQLRREWLDAPQSFDGRARDLMAALPRGLISHVTVVDADGRSVYNSLGSTQTPNLADRAHFQVHLEGGGQDRLYVGRPVSSRLATDTWTVIANRPLLRDGRFAGSLNLSVPTDYFANQLAALSLGERDVVTLVHPDGSFIARSRGHAEAMGRTLPASRPFLLDREAAGGLFRVSGEVDGVARLHAWTRLPGTGLVVVVGLAEDEALQPLAANHERERLLFGALLAVMLVGGIAVAALLWQGSRRQQALERNERRYRLLLDSSPDAIFVAREGRFWYVNPATLKLLGAQDPSQLVGRPVLDHIHPDYHPIVAARRGQLQRRQPVSAQEERYLRLDGSEVEVEVTAAPFIDEHGVCSQVIVRDVTERRRAARALQQLADDLERRVSERTGELERARDEAERANRAKSEFLSRMSHELRTPLNAILGFGQLLALELREPGPRGQVQQILDAGQHLLVLINDVLDLARIEAGHLAVSTEVVALQPLVADCLALLRQQAQARQIELSAPTADDRRQLRADRTRLKQVLLNLLANAIKYNRAGGRVALVVEDSGESWRICVDDTGPGLDAGQQARLFVPFERLGAAASAIEGTGIGLALSRRLVELMHGRIGVISERGRGSRFWVELPKAPDLAPAPTPALPAPDVPGEDAAQGQYELLYIEDNPVNMLLVQHIVALRPRWRLLTASLPSQGLLLARTRRPRMVLLDIHLPEMDGFAVMRALREDVATRHIPVVAVSAHAMPGDLARGRAAGFTDYLTKPLDLTRMLALLDAAEDSEWAVPA